MNKNKPVGTAASGAQIWRPHLIAWGPVALWQALLGVIALLNLVLWTVAAVTVSRIHTGSHGGIEAASYLQLILSAAYVIGCAYRCALPVYDIPRIVLVDSRLSSVVIGRSVATIAEICFAIQWALILHRTATLGHSPFIHVVSWLIVPLVLLAEVCSWHAVLTTEQRGHIAENSIWGLAASLLVIGLLMVGADRLVQLYPPMIVWVIAGACYAVFIFFFDVPMYWSRWLKDQARGRRALSIAQGFADARARRVVSYRWEDWKNEVLWMSLYFSFGVWSSISLVYATVALGGHGT